MNYRYRRAQQRNWEIETHQWFLLFTEFLWKLQHESSINEGGTTLCEEKESTAILSKV